MKRGVVNRSLEIVMPFPVMLNSASGRIWLQSHFLLDIFSAIGKFGNFENE
jgi:hypothetical protein